MYCNSRRSYNSIAVIHDCGLGRSGMYLNWELNYEIRSISLSSITTDLILKMQFRFAVALFQGRCEWIAARISGFWTAFKKRDAML